MPVMSAPALPVTQTQRAQLQKMATSTTLPHRKVVQARALLWAAQGLANQEIARRCEVDSDTVRRWRKRFTDKGIDGIGATACRGKAFHREFSRRSKRETSLRVDRNWATSA